MASCGSPKPCDVGSNPTTFAKIMNEKDFNSFINYLYNKGLTNGDSGDSGYGHYYDMIKYLKELRKTHLNSIQSWWYNYTLTGK